MQRRTRCLHYPGVLQVAVALILKLAAVDGFPAFTCARRISSLHQHSKEIQQKNHTALNQMQPRCLDHKTRHDAMETHTIIISSCC